MGFMAGVTQRLKALFRGRERDQEMEEELRHHLALETEQNIRRGLPPEEAARQARLTFGGLEATREAHRDARGVRWLQDALADARYALRSLARNPVLAVSAVLTLALGIGANTAIFSAVEAVLLRPLPFEQPGRLVMLWEENPEKGWVNQVAAPANMLDWQAQVAAFDGVAGWASWRGTSTLTGSGDARLLKVATVTANFFQVLGVPLALGRSYTEAENWNDAPRTVIISDRLWREQFGADPGIIGRSVELDGAGAQVIGVAPAGFAYPFDGLDAWWPMGWNRDAVNQLYFRRAHWISVVARLKPGVTLAAADAQLQTVVRRLQVQYPETNRVMGAGMTPLHEFQVGQVRKPLLLLLGAVAVLLLIACVNVGNLLLVRAAGREREAALRLALGAERGRLVRQALTESLVVSLMGGVVGLAVGWWGTRTLVLLQPAGMLPVQSIGMNWAVLAFVALVAALSGVLFGIAPALWGARRAPSEILKDSGSKGAGTGFRVRRWSEALVITEVALALILTVGAGLLVRSFARVSAVDPGFDGDHVLAASLELPRRAYPTGESRVDFFARLTERARALPGVRQVSLASSLPLTGTTWSSDFTAEGWDGEHVGVEVWHREIGTGYFAAMGVPLLRGRDFTPEDVATSPPVVIINDALAQRYFPNEDPVGRRVTFDRVPDSNSVWRTIVGVAGDEHQENLATEPKIEFMAPLAQETNRSFAWVLLNASSDPAALGPAFRRLVRELDPNLVVQDIRQMRDVVTTSLAERRFVLALLMVFAVVGFSLAVIGVYGVMAQLARSRTREMGIRIALGAQGQDVQWLVIRRGLQLVGSGLLIGLVCALFATRSMRALLYQTPPSDPPTFVTVALLLVGTSLVACWIPALRASRADPVASLGGE